MAVRRPSPQSSRRRKASALIYARHLHAFHELLPMVRLLVFMVCRPGRFDLRKLAPHVTVLLLRGQAPTLISGARTWLERAIARRQGQDRQGRRRDSGAAVGGRLSAAGGWPTLTRRRGARSRGAHLVRQRTRLKSQVQAILQRNLVPCCPAADLFGHKGRA
jgi:hypothetical protein